jgi:hypothetical protein
LQSPSVVFENSPSFSNEFQAYVYVLIRADIPVADQLVQAGHACLEAGSRFRPPECSSNLVVLGVDSEARLLAAVEKAEAAGIRCVVFHELGYSAACSEPVHGALRCVFRSFRLWKLAEAAQEARPPPERGLDPGTP